MVWVFMDENQTDQTKLKHGSEWIVLCSGIQSFEEFTVTYKETVDREDGLSAAVSTTIWDITAVVRRVIASNEAQIEG